MSEQNQEISSTLKEDSEVDQVQLRAPIRLVDTSLQLNTSIIETDSCIELIPKTDESEISVLSTVPMDDSNISVQSTGSAENVSQLIDSIITTNSSVQLASRINESDISVQPTSSMNDADISVEATTLLNEADLFVQPTTSVYDADISVEATTLLNEADLFVQPTISINKADISVEATALLNEADISVQPTTPINEADNRVEPTTRLDEAGTSVQQTAPMSEAEMSTQSTTPMNDADISAEAATSMSEAAISVQLTASMSEAGISVQPMYPRNIEALTARINEVKISVQSTVPMTVGIISGPSSATDSFVEPIHEADSNAQPTDQINEADTSVEPTEQINEADLSSTEEYKEAFRIFQWIERKLDLLKIVQGNDENVDNNAQNEHRDMSLNEKSTLLERMLEEISQQMTSTNIAEKDDYFSKEVTRMLNMLEETTLEVLDSVKVAKSKLTSFKVLAVLIKHLVADIGSEIKLHDVQTFIDGPRVMKLFTDVQVAREPRYLKMSVVKSNLELGIRKAQYVKRKSSWYKSKAEWIDSECARTVDIRSANQQLKTLARESEVVLLKYKESVKFVLTKAKVFMTLKTDNEDVLGYFLTTEVHDMYKKEI